MIFLARKEGFVVPSSEFPCIDKAVAIRKKVIYEELSFDSRNYIYSRRASE